MWLVLQVPVLVSRSLLAFNSVLCTVFCGAPF